ncbi:PEP-CTERM sorting domain-containing protein [Kinneretia asaccharophila]|nr:PEP-CTERM sorting domain-containing protein [Roseateles asaccharophilus]
MNVHAAIGSGSSSQSGAAGARYANGQAVLNNPELFLSVFDPEAKVSYTLDLGLDVESFFINAQQDAGMQWFKPVDDANWDSFLGMSSRNKLRWVVLAADNNGGLAAGQKRLFTTLTQGTEAKLRDWTNQDFTNAIGEAVFESFIRESNVSGTHAVPLNDYASNGSHVATSLDVSNKRAYFGKQASGVSLDESLNGTTTQRAGFTVGNRLDESSWFYYVTRSSTTQTAKVTVDEFDNLGADGYWGFTYVDPAANASSPYAGKFLLSYTLDKAGVKATTAAGMLRMSLTDYLAADRFLPLLLQQGALAGEYQGYRQSSLVLPDSGLPGLGGTNSVAAGLNPVSAVPEPASWGLMGLGLAGLLAWRRRQQAAGG